MSYSIDKFQELEQLIIYRLQDLRSILEEKHNLSLLKASDEFLIRCLRVKDGNVDKAVKLIRALNDSIAEIQGWDGVVVRPSYGHHFLNSGVISPMLKRDPVGRRIFVMRMALWDTTVTPFDQGCACAWMLAQFGNAEFIDVQRLGTVQIWDFQDFTLQQAWAMKQWRIPSLGRMAKNGIGGRVKAFHVINHPKIVNAVCSAFKPFLGEKLRKRIHFHANPQSLMKHLEPDLLPDFLGGTQNPDKCFDWEFIQALLKYDHYFEGEENQ